MLYILIGSAIGICISLILAILGWIIQSTIAQIGALIIFILCVGICVGAIIAFFTQKDDFRKAIIFIDDGTQVNKTNGIYMDIQANAVRYKYNNHILIVPNNYGFKYLTHKRKIDVDANNNLIYSSSNKLLLQSRYSELIKTITLGGIGTEMVKAVSSSKFSMNIIIIAIICVIAGAALMGIYTSFQKNNTTQSSPASQSVPPKPIIIEGK